MPFKKVTRGPFWGSAQLPEIFRKFKSKHTVQHLFCISILSTHGAAPTLTQNLPLYNSPVLVYAEPMTNEPQPATEVVPVDRFADLLPGDVVVETDRTYDGDLVRVRRSIPPKPKLPTTNGSIVTQAYQDKDAELGRIAAFLLDGTWYDTARPGRRVGVPSVWATGWTLVYEAPSLEVDEAALQNLVSNLLYRYDNEESFGVVTFTRRILTFLKEGN